MSWRQPIVSLASNTKSAADCKWLWIVFMANQIQIVSQSISCTQKRKRIRLGEFNTQTERDCMKYGRRKICADPVVEVGFDKIIVHTNYSEQSSHRYHDIALVRLDRNVNSTKYIRPICLPVDGQSSGIRAGNRLTVAGWGQTDLCMYLSIHEWSVMDDFGYSFSAKIIVFQRHGYVLSSVKLKLKLPIVSNDRCQESLVKIQLGPGQVCAGGIKGQDSCSADRCVYGDKQFRFFSNFNFHSIRQWWSANVFRSGTCNAYIVWCREFWSAKLWIGRFARRLHQSWILYRLDHCQYGEMK